MSHSIVTLCDKGFVGVNRACLGLAQNTGLTRHLILTHADPQGVESTFILEHLLQIRPRLVVLCGGWSHLYERFAKELSDSDLALGMWWLSSGGQLGLAGEVEMFVKILQDGRLRRLFCSSRSLFRALSGRFAQLAYLAPNFTIPKGPLRPPREPGQPAQIGLFCGPAERARKNVANCLLALSSLKLDYRLHLNGLSQDVNYLALLEMLKIAYLDHGWIAEDEMDGLLRSLDLGLQVSFAETFAYPVVEYLLRGVPVVASKMVPALALLPPRLGRQMVVDSADDPGQIAEKIEQILADPKRGQSLARRARPHLLRARRDHCECARQTLLQALEELA